MTTREELEALPSKELHDRAMALAKHRLDVGFLWDLLKTLPEAEAVAGNEERSEIDIVRPLALLNDLTHSGEGAVAEALRPFYLDYLARHEGTEPGEG
jgi:hypothetical protein